jgi:hypothetical protein
VIRYGVSAVQKGEGSITFAFDILMHPDYKNDDYTNARYDVAVVKVATRIELAPRYAVAQPIAHPGVRFDDFTNCTLVGYGISGYPNIDQNQPAKLRTVELITNMLEVCRRYLAIGEGVFCAHHAENNAGPCSVLWISSVP